MAWKILFNPKAMYRRGEGILRSNTVSEKFVSFLELWPDWMKMEPVAWKVKKHMNDLYLQAATQPDLENSRFARQIGDLAIVLGNPRFAGNLASVFPGITGERGVRLEITSDIAVGNYGGIIKAIIDMCNNERMSDRRTPIEDMVDRILLNAEKLRADQNRGIPDENERRAALHYLINTDFHEADNRHN